MKTIFCILIFALVSEVAKAQNQYSILGPDSLYGKNLSQAQLYQLKVDNYTSMKRTGSTLAIVGIPCTIAGITLIIVGTDNVNKIADTSTGYKGIKQQVAGIVFSGVGMGMLVAGIVFGSIGNNKTKEYQIKRDALKINSDVTSKSIGLKLTYRF